MEEFITIENTQGYVSEEVRLNKIVSKAVMSLNAENEFQLSFESSYMKRFNGITERFTTIKITLPNDDLNPKGFYILKVRNGGWGYALRFVSKSGKFNELYFPHDEKFYPVLSKFEALLNSKYMDSVTSSVLTYVLNQIKTFSFEGQSCPDFLTNLIQIAKSQEKRNKSNFNV